jgi:hypothetical protein
MQEAISKTLEQLAHDLFLKELSEAPIAQRLHGLSPEDIVAGLSEEEATKLRELLERKQRK